MSTDLADQLDASVQAQRLERELVSIWFALQTRGHCQAARAQFRALAESIIRQLQEMK